MLKKLENLLDEYFNTVLVGGLLIGEAIMIGYTIFLGNKEYKKRNNG